MIYFIMIINLFKLFNNINAFIIKIINNFIIFITAYLILILNYISLALFSYSYL